MQQQAYWSQTGMYSPNSPTNDKTSQYPWLQHPENHTCPPNCTQKSSWQFIPNNSTQYLSVPPSHQSKHDNSNAENRPLARAPSPTSNSPSPSSSTSSLPDSTETKSNPSPRKRTLPTPAPTTTKKSKPSPSSSASGPHLTTHEIAMQALRARCERNQFSATSAAARLNGKGKAEGSTPRRLPTLLPSPSPPSDSGLRREVGKESTSSSLTPSLNGSNSGREARGLKANDVCGSSVAPASAPSPPADQLKRKGGGSPLPSLASLCLPTSLPTQSSSYHHPQPFSSSSVTHFPTSISPPMSFPKLQSISLSPPLAPHQLPVVANSFGSKGALSSSGSVVEGASELELGQRRRAMEGAAVAPLSKTMTSNLRSTSMED